MSKDFLTFVIILVIPDDEYDPGHSEDSNYYQDFIGDHTRIIGGSIVSMIINPNEWNLVKESG